VVINLCIFLLKPILKGDPCLLYIKFNVQGHEVVIPLGHHVGNKK